MKLFYKYFYNKIVFLLKLLLGRILMDLNNVPENYVKNCLALLFVMIGLVLHVWKEIKNWEE